ncbi:GlpM family protein [Vogesella facilis]|uniref:GlpM family protein n=1 Tax=Vogesella facilis TaxID=1655232 RepID=A0ABV7RB11_9NEIS
MMAPDLALGGKALLGALAVLLISLLSQSRYFVIAGLVPLFPTFALIAHYMVGSALGADALRHTALFGLFSLLPYAVYLLAVYGLATRLSLPFTLLAATACWMLAAGVLLWSWHYWMH